MENLENLLTTAFVSLCAIPVSGPAVVPMGRALESVNEALAQVRKLRGETEPPAEEGPRQ